MKIQNITNLYNPFKVKRFNTLQTNRVSNPFLNNTLTGDVVSFRAKSYSSETIENPTNHCAYCGCKVYNEAQIESLAKEMLRDSSHRLQGDIKSVLEKLETAERSYELTVAKQMENKKEIEFYRKFLQQAEDKSWLKGEAIFQQVYDMDSETAFEAMKKNLRPLTKTIDHVSPQNLGEENKDADINLVEACYCCNHDLKKGMPFSEFYTMYPSIKENMPVDKFKYAHSQLLSSSSSSILSRVSASNLIKYVSGLFEQRTRAVTQLGNVDFRILESQSSVSNSIQTCRNEIKEKEGRITELRAKLKEISGDEEYIAMLERLSLLQKKQDIETELSTLRERRQNTSNSLNELTNPPKKSKSKKTKPRDIKSNMSQDQIEQKKASLKQALIELKGQIEKKEQEAQLNESELANLDEMYPTIEILQARKQQYDNVVTAYAQLAQEESKHSDLTHIGSLQDFDISQLDEQIDSYPKEDFDSTKFSQEEQAQYALYTSFLDAIKYIEQHSNSGGVKSVVNKSARLQIERDIEELSKLPVIIAAKKHLEKKELISKREKTREERATTEKGILSAKNRIIQLKRTTSMCSLSEAKEQSATCATTIRRLNEKQNYLKIPQVIEALEAEIIMLRSAITDLSAKKEQIDSLNLQQP